MPVNATAWGSRASLILLILVSVVVCRAAPSQRPNVPKDRSNRLQYTISRAETAARDQSDVDQSASLPNNGFLQALGKSGIVQSVMNAFNEPASQQSSKQRENDNSKDVGLPATRQLQHDQPAQQQQGPDFGLSSFDLDAFAPDENVWKKTLFGPSGLLTEIFNVVNDKRKESIEKEKTGKSQADPDLPTEASTDFSKILDSLLSKSQSGNFDEPLPELPFIGICNRLNCGDIYKAVDEFRKSELFSNFQTALSLIHDPKGWDIIGDLLANPELIEKFTGKSNIQELLRGGGGSKSQSKAKSASTVDSKSLGEVKSGDGDLGVDFSHLVDELPAGVEKESNLEIAESVDSPDYYSSVDKPGEEVERQVEPSIVAHKKETTSPAAPSRFSEAMPEIAESIDGMPEGFESAVVEKQEIVPTLEKSNYLTNLGANATGRRTLTSNIVVRPVMLTKAPSVRQRFYQEIGGNVTTGSGTQATKTVKWTTLRHLVHKPTLTTTTPIPTTRKNFRKENDYYAMYYDG